jgi:hypothetical protein
MEDAGICTDGQVVPIAPLKSSLHSPSCSVRGWWNICTETWRCCWWSFCNVWRCRRCVLWDLGSVIRMYGAVYRPCVVMKHASSMSGCLASVSAAIFSRSPCEVGALVCKREGSQPRAFPTNDKLYCGTYLNFLAWCNSDRTFSSCSWEIGCDGVIWRRTRGTLDSVGTFRHLRSEDLGTSMMRMGMMQYN